uniref:Drug metabolite transporter superfamily n=1 Tax=Tetraselmis sp. GSL018 TaxID=582737 RepID=A0A061RWP0_9CHLO
MSSSMSLCRHTPCSPYSCTINSIPFHRVPTPTKSGEFFFSAGQPGCIQMTTISNTKFPRPSISINALKQNEVSVDRTVPAVQTEETTGDLHTSDISEPKSTGGLSMGAFQGSTKGLILLNIGAILFGTNNTVIKAAEDSCPPALLSAVRFSMAAVCFAPWIVEGVKNKEVRKSATELGLWLFAGYLAQAVGLSSTTASHGALTGTFTVLIVPMLVGFSGRSVPTSTWVAAVVALLGVGLLTTSDTTPNAGDAWCILSAVLFGTHKFRSESVTKAMEDSTQQLMALQLAVLAGSSCIAAGFEVFGSSEGLQQGLATLQEVPLPSLVYMGVASTALTLWIEMESLKEVSAPIAALIYSSEPLYGAGFAYAFLGDRWGPQGWFGAFLIVAACLASQLAESLRASRTET